MIVLFSARVAMMDELSGQPSGAARRRRERRLRSMLRHEQQTVRMALAAALHHSAGPKEKVEMQQNGAPRGQKTAAKAREVEEQAAHDDLRAQTAPPPGVRPGSLAEPGPQRSDRSLRRSSGQTPLLGVPSLADAPAEAIDGRTLRYLLKANLARKKYEEEEEEEKRYQERAAETRRRAQALLDHEEEKRLLDPLPILRFAALIVDNGSGMCWLVFLVTIHLVLCFRLVSMSVAIPQVKAICPLLFRLVLLVRQCRCDGVDIVQSDHAPEAGVAQGIFHGDLIRHRWKRNWRKK